MKKRIGLTQRVVASENLLERRDCIDQAWAKLLVGAGFWPVFLSNSIGHSTDIIEQMNLDGVILTGGNDLSILPQAKDAAPERDALEKQLLDCCALKRLPVLGVCRGLQMMICHYGGRIVPIANHVACQHTLNVLLKELLPCPQGLVVNSFHNFGVRQQDVPKDICVVAIAPDQTVEAIAHRQFPQWGIMWHPERPPETEINHLILKRIFSE